jgi:hypothetical protein
MIVLSCSKGADLRPEKRARRSAIGLDPERGPAFAAADAATPGLLQICYKGASPYGEMGCPDERLVRIALSFAA